MEYLGLLIILLLMVVGFFLSEANNKDKVRATNHQDLIDVWFYWRGSAEWMKGQMLEPWKWLVFYETGRTPLMISKVKIPRAWVMNNPKIFAYPMFLYVDMPPQDRHPTEDEMIAFVEPPSLQSSPYRP